MNGIMFEWVNLMKVINREGPPQPGHLFGKDSLGDCAKHSTSKALSMLKVEKEPPQRTISNQN
jgi:hypothetical protein